MVRLGYFLFEKNKKKKKKKKMIKEKILVFISRLLSQFSHDLLKHTRVARGTSPRLNTFTMPIVARSIVVAVFLAFI